jgi:FKBP-type peptidyl-prolyl cis-trans isomerase
MAATVTRKWGVVLGAALLAAQASAGETPASALESLRDQVSYGIGVDIARSFKLRGIEPDVDLVTKGLKDELAGGTLLVPEEELRGILTAFRHELILRRWSAAKTAAQENKKKGEAFLVENARKQGVVTLPSGLQYKILEAGSGKRPTEADTVTCRYRSTLIDGSELDRSEAGKTATFKLSEVIPGWREALRLMPVGSKWQLFIPPDLAYGERGADARIGPNATLIFEVELVSIRDSEKAGL